MTCGIRLRAYRVRAVALDFTLPPELRDLLDRVRAYVEEEALPAEADVADPADLLQSWDVVERLRDRARERGLYTPQLPEAWGGLGIGPLGMALISQECGVSGLASVFPERVVEVIRDPSAEGAAALGELRAGLERFPRHAAFKFVLGLRGVPVREDVRAPLRPLRDDEREELRRWLESS